MTNTHNHAKQELDIMIAQHPDPENRATVEPFYNEILALAEKFGNSGQSGGSASMVAPYLGHVITELLLFQPISPLTGAPEEWMDVTDIGPADGKTIYQNRRNGVVFKEGIDGAPYFLDAIIFETPNGVRYSSNAGAILPNGERVYSRQFIKGFPFEPKKFYINIREEEVAKDDWEFYLDDTTQLKAVFDYYKKPDNITL